MRKPLELNLKTRSKIKDPKGVYAKCICLPARQHVRRAILGSEKHGQCQNLLPLQQYVGSTHLMLMPESLRRGAVPNSTVVPAPLYLIVPECMR